MIVFPNFDYEFYMDCVFKMFKKENLMGRKIVLGISGGIDSLVTFSILDNLNKHFKIDIIPVFIETDFNSNKKVLVEKFFENSNYNLISLNVSNNFNEIINRMHTLDKLLNYTNDEVKFHNGNILSRLIAFNLNNIAGRYNALVVSTSNADEDFIGYYTMFGDGLGHFNLLKAISKRNIKLLGKKFGLDDTLIFQEPSADLFKGQSDWGELGYTWETVELCRILKSDNYFNLDIIKSEIDGRMEYYFDKYKFKDLGDVFFNINYRFNEISLKKKKIIHPIYPILFVEETQIKII